MFEIPFRLLEDDPGLPGLFEADADSMMISRGVGGSGRCGKPPRPLVAEIEVVGKKKNEEEERFLFQSEMAL